MASSIAKSILIGLLSGGWIVPFYLAAAAWSICFGVLRNEQLSVLRLRSKCLANRRCVLSGVGRVLGFVCRLPLADSSQERAACLTFLGGLFESGRYPDTTFGPAPGAAHRLAARIRALRMNEATAKRNLKTARIFVIEPPTSTPAVPDRNDTETDTKKGSRTYKNGRRRYEAAERHDRQCRIATRQCESEQDQLRPCVEIGALARLLPLLFLKTRKRVRKRAKPRDVRIPAGSRR